MINICPEEIKQYLDLARNFLDFNRPYTISDTDYINERDAYVFDYSKYKLCLGATKLVLIPRSKELSYIIKIPAKGFICYNEDKEIEYTQYFENAPMDFEWNYCAVEEEVFKLATLQNLAHLFSETKHIGDVDGHPIYIQEFVSHADACFGDPSKGSMQIVDKLYSINNHVSYFLPEVFAGSVIDNYGLDILERLIEFLFGNHISDFHGGNVGYDENKLPKLFDYSGFYDN